MRKNINALFIWVGPNANNDCMREVYYYYHRKTFFFLSSRERKTLLYQLPSFYNCYFLTCPTRKNVIIIIRLTDRHQVVWFRVGKSWRERRRRSFVYCARIKKSHNALINPRFGRSKLKIFVIVSVSFRSVKSAKLFWTGRLR